jgi:hypothetical protein
VVVQAMNETSQNTANKVVDLNQDQLEIILNAIDTHEGCQLPDEIAADPERVDAIDVLRSIRDKFESDPPVLMLTTEEIFEIREALDSHKYWDLSDMHYRSSGFVLDPGSDDPEVAEAIASIDELEARLGTLEEKPAKTSKKEKK